MTERKSRSAGDGIVITRVFDAPRSMVFKAWTQAKHLKQWSAPFGFTIPHSKGDLRPGGDWRACMRMPDGKRLWLSGVYREVVQDELLVFSHGWEDEKGRRGHETLVTVRFADYGAKTKMIFEQVNFESMDSRDGHADGWAECFSRLKDYLKQINKSENPHERKQ